MEWFETRICKPADDYEQIIDHLIKAKETYEELLCSEKEKLICEVMKLILFNQTRVLLK